jgi:ribulose 1,5-bisphosphate synthetase/thiazole synthase
MTEQRIPLLIVGGGGAGLTASQILARPVGVRAAV